MTSRSRAHAAVDLRHQEALFLGSALFIPAFPLPAEMFVELLAAICERDAVADALLRLATLQRAASRTPHLVPAGAGAESLHRIQPPLSSRGPWG